MAKTKRSTAEAEWEEIKQISLERLNFEKYGVNTIDVDRIKAKLARELKSQNG